VTSGGVELQFRVTTNANY